MEFFYLDSIYDPLNLEQTITYTIKTDLSQEVIKEFTKEYDVKLESNQAKLFDHPFGASYEAAKVLHFYQPAQTEFLINRLAADGTLIKYNFKPAQVVVRYSRNVKTIFDALI